MREEENKKNMNKKEAKNIMCLPKDITLPFFAYGFFKPGELAYHQIEKYVGGSTEKACVYGRFYEKDGVPILKPDDGKDERHKVRGVIMVLREEAYNRISQIEPSALYQWSTVQAYRKLNEVTVNILVYAGDDSNIDEIPGAELIEEEIPEWHCHEDPLMNKGMNYLRYKYFNPVVENQQINRYSIFSNEFYENIFQMQMAYVFLWTIMDRYKSLKYGLIKNISDGNKILSQSALWKKSIRHLCRNLDMRNRDVLRAIVRTNETRSRYNLMDRFYSIRCNAVHRGKAVHHDGELLTQAFLLLYTIMTYITTCDINHEPEIAEKQLIQDCRAIKPFLSQF